MVIESQYILALYNQKGPRGELCPHPACCTPQHQRHLGHLALRRRSALNPDVLGQSLETFDCSPTVCSSASWAPGCLFLSPPCISRPYRFMKMQNKLCISPSAFPRLLLALNPLADTCRCHAHSILLTPAHLASGSISTANQTCSFLPYSS